MFVAWEYFVSVTQLLEPEPEAVLDVLDEGIPKDFLEMNHRAFVYVGPWFAVSVQKIYLNLNRRHYE